MSRPHLIILAAPVVAALAAPSALLAQRVEHSPRLELAVRPVNVYGAGLSTTRAVTELAPLVPVVPAAPAARAEGEGTSIGTVVRAIVGVGGGALVGGWLGYFTSQVGRSDWDRLPSAEKNSVRQRFTATGAGFGAVAGYFMRPKVRRPRGIPQPLNIPARTGRQLFASTELRRSIATNALEAVELGRPEWTKQQRQDESRQPGAARTGAVEAISVVVYVGEEQLGNLETLRDVAIPEVAELRFYDARDARRRWGKEHKYGAIEVVPVGTSGASASGATGAVPEPTR